MRACGESVVNDTEQFPGQFLEATNVMNLTLLVVKPEAAHPPLVTVAQRARVSDDVSELAGRYLNEIHGLAADWTFQNTGAHRNSKMRLGGQGFRAWGVRQMAQGRRRQK